MTEQEFIKRWLMHYFHPEYFYIPWGDYVNIRLIEKIAYENGVYLPQDEIDPETGERYSPPAQGYSKFTVNVPPTPITLDYILTNGVPVFATPKNPADGTPLENTLSDYTINIYIVKHEEESVSSINHVEWSISPNPTEYRDTYISNLSYPYLLYCVYYYDDEAVCAQQVGFYQRPPRGEKYYTNYKWGTPISEYFKPSPHYTDWDYEIDINSETELVTSVFSSNRYYFYVSNIDSRGYIDLVLKDTQYPTSSYAKFLYQQKTYTYLLDPPPPVLTNVNTTTYEEDIYIRIFFPGIFQYENSYEFIRKEGMTLAEQNDFLKEIAAKIHQYYMS